MRASARSEKARKRATTRTIDIQVVRNQRNLYTLQLALSAAVGNNGTQTVSRGPSVENK